MDAVIDEEEVKYEWSDDRCFEIANTHYFPSSIKSRDVQKGIITDFFNFYLGGKCRTGLDITDLVFAVLSIVPATPKIDDDVWPSSEYKADGSLFYISPAEKLKATVDSNQHQSSTNVRTQDKTNAGTEAPPIAKVIPSSKADIFKSKIDIPSDHINPVRETDKHEDIDEVVISSDEFNSDIEHEQPELNFTPLSIKYFNATPYVGGVGFAKVLEYGPAENAAFINSVTILLGRWSEPDGRARAMLKYFFAVTALILMRSTTKGYKHLEYAFSNDKFLYLINFSNYDIQYSVPRKRCLKTAYRTFMKRDKKTPVMFAKIIKLYLLLPDKHKLKITIKNALLSHTSFYGFTLVNLWQTISQSVVDFEASTIENLSRTAKTEESWCRLTAFSKKYSEQKTFYWARVINTKYFTELSCPHNYELAVILAVFVEKLTNNSNVWKATWVDSGNIKEAKEEAHAIYEIYRRCKNNF